MPMMLTISKYGMGILAFSFLLATVHADPVINDTITYSTCVSPSGMQSCFAEANSFHTQCVAKATTIEEGASCDCVLQLASINCALANCWNVVYGCEYQNLVKDYLSYCNGDDVPFFPAPDNAPGGCSCNLGHVLYNVSASVNRVGPCSQNGNLDEISACSCCTQAGAYTALYDICPGVDLDLLEYIGLDTILTIEDPQINQCGTYFNNYDCVKDLGYQPIGSLSLLTSLPTTTPTGTFSTTGGVITSPLSGATFTWTALGIANTITAVSASGNHGSGSGSGSTSKSTASNGGNQATPTGAGGSSGSSGSITKSSASTFRDQAFTNRPTRIAVFLVSWLAVTMMGY